MFFDDNKNIVGVTKSRSKYIRFGWKLKRIKEEQTILKWWEKCESRNVLDLIFIIINTNTK